MTPVGRQALVLTLADARCGDATEKLPEVTPSAWISQEDRAAVAARA